MFKNIISLILISLMGSSCSLMWPYVSDFDCPIPEGEGCLSLHEVMQRIDRGEVELDDTVQQSKRASKLKQTKKIKLPRNIKKGYCNAG